MSKTIPTTERMHTVPQFAQRIGYSRAAAYELLSSGMVRHLRLPGTGSRRNLRVPESAIVELIEKSTCGGAE